MVCAGRPPVAQGRLLARPSVCRQLPLARNNRCARIWCKSAQFDAQVAVILGTQWGDEGKGKLVDILAKQYDIVARAQGGANAGHTIYDDDGNKYALHLVPSGILNEGTRCVIGNGVVVHVPSLFNELENLKSKGVAIEGRVEISDRAHLLFDLHKEVDGLREAELAGKSIGTTKRGIGPAYASKATRNGLRVCDLSDKNVFESKFTKLVEDAKARFPDGLNGYNLKDELAQYESIAAKILPMVTDTVDLINTAVEDGQRVLVEGANATMLDVDFGTYPFVTSSNPSIGGVITGLGLAPNKFNAVIGVAKAYSTRVGAGPYPTEIFGQLAESIREEGGEYGTTTGRPRRVGWLDMVALRFATRVNGLTHLNLTKLDVLSKLDEVPICTAYVCRESNKRFTCTVPANANVVDEVEVEYETLPGWTTDISGVRIWEDLPKEAQAYCQRVEDLCGVHCKWIGVGPGRDAMVEKPKNV